MKKIIYIAAAAAALAAMSCTRELELNTATDLTDQSVKLSFSCGNLATKADGDDVATVNNEDRVNRIDFFIFPLNVDENGKMIGSTEYVYKGELVPEAQAENNQYTKNITNDPDFNLNKIFPNGAKKAMIFAVANYTSKEGITETTWKGLHSLEVGDTFTKDAGEGFGKRWPHPMETDNAELYFVMTGEKEIQLATNSTQYAIQETIPMNRLASKVTVEFDYTHSVYKDEKGVTWVPENLLNPKPAKQEARVYMSNAFCHATLGGPQTRTPIVPDGYVDSKYVPRPDRDIFEYAYDFLADAKEGQLHYYYTYPYPAQIDNGDNQPYLKLVLPWYGYKNYGTENEVFFKKKEVYYKIVLPSNSITESNKLYQYKVDVRIIGSETEVEVTGEEYRVKEWLSNGDISSSVATGRYISLDIPKDTYDLYSDRAEILFISSGEVEISHLTIYQDDFSSVNSDKIYFIDDNTYKKDRTTPDIDGTQLQNWVKIEGTQVIVQHQMNNDFSDEDFDAAPMTFVITLHLKNETSTRYDRTITVTQYPALYVKMEKHFGHVFVNKYGSDNYVNAWDNRGAQNNYYNYNDRFLGSILPQNYEFPSSQQGGGTNPNNYTVYVSNLAGTNWVIGNPTEESDLNYLISGYRKASAVNSDILVAPSFKIASSYGAIPNGQGLYGVPTYDGAVKRCASYQENGYPAGRWRVPTEAEILFCISLSEYGKIPTLFGGAYYASSGRYYSTSDGEFLEASRASVRCVYDVWYWGEEKSDACYSGDDAQGNKLYNKWGGFQN